MLSRLASNSAFFAPPPIFCLSSAPPTLLKSERKEREHVIIETESCRLRSRLLKTVIAMSSIYDAPLLKVQSDMADQSKLLLFFCVEFQLVTKLVKTSALKVLKVHLVLLTKTVENLMRPEVSFSLVIFSLVIFLLFLYFIVYKLINNISIISLVNNDF